MSRRISVSVLASIAIIRSYRLAAACVSAKFLPGPPDRRHENDRKTRSQVLRSLTPRVPRLDGGHLRTEAPMEVSPESALVPLAVTTASPTASVATARF